MLFALSGKNDLAALYRDNLVQVFVAVGADYPIVPRSAIRDLFNMADVGKAKAFTVETIGRDGMSDRHITLHKAFSEKANGGAQGGGERRRAMWRMLREEERAFVGPKQRSGRRRDRGFVTHRQGGGEAVCVLFRVRRCQGGGETPPLVSRPLREEEEGPELVVLWGGSIKREEEMLPP